jgi:hypothetical protein
MALAQHGGEVAENVGQKLLEALLVASWIAEVAVLALFQWSAGQCLPTLAPLVEER